MLTRILLFGAVLAGFGTAAAWSVRLACADYWFQMQTAPAIRKAISLTPGQADYYFQLALLDPDETGAAATGALERAVALNPADSKSWIELGLRYERAGQRDLAERTLLRAAVEDKQYFPRWTLANFYYRAEDLPNFWRYVRQSAGLVYGDPSPLFRLCGRVAEDGALIDRLDIQRREIRASYLSYLLGRNRTDLIGPATRYVLNGTGAAEVPLLLTACDRLLESENQAAALDIWNSLADGHKLPFARLDIRLGLVTNAGFHIAPASRGFDWRLPAVEGVSISNNDGGGLRLTFSGGQPENCELLAQFVPVQKGMRHELTFEYLTSGIAAGSGLEWRLTDQNGLRRIAAADGLSSGDWASRTVSFEAPSDCQLARLGLVYRRAPGTTRIEGYVVLRTVQIAVAGHKRSR